MGIVEVIVVIIIGVALASALCWLVYSAAVREAQQGWDSRHGDRWHG